MYATLDEPQILATVARRTKARRIQGTRAPAGQYVCDPLGFVQDTYPWGQGPLSAWDGPDTWQTEVLTTLGQDLAAGTYQRFAVAAGKGIGKGALAAMLVHWFIATRPHPQIVVTANTKAQLETKTWRELAKWHQLSAPLQQDYTWTKTLYQRTQTPATWFAAAIPWNEHKPEAFSGTHDQDVLMIADEASILPDTICDAIEGCLTTPGALCVFLGNPTRTTGRFREIFPGGRFAHRWRTWQIDSRTCRHTDKDLIAEWIADWGEDSDYIRVNVQGQFPRQAVGQFIGEDLIAAARERHAVDDPLQPTIIGVDVARFGDDRSVILVRCGGTIRETRIYREIDTVRLAGFVCEVADQYRSQRPTLFVDAVGIGAGVVDQCRARGYAVQEVQAGGSAQDPLHYANKRAEMWDRTREWLRSRGCLADTAVMRELATDLQAPEYAYDRQGRLQIETKASMKSRGLASSDVADALVHTFCEPVALKASAAQPYFALPPAPLAGVSGWQGG
jgi:hypothetical protein